MSHVIPRESFTELGRRKEKAFLKIYTRGRQCFEFLFTGEWIRYSDENTSYRQTLGVAELESSQAIGQQSIGICVSSQRTRAAVEGRSA
jgi:hypothetical protein